MTQDNANEMQTILDEFKNICPEITRCSLFKENGEAVASSQEATKEEGEKILAAFNNISAYTDVLSGVATLTIQGANSQLTVQSVNNHILTTVSSRAADERIVKSLTCVVVPTVLDLMNRPVPCVVNEDTSQVIEPEPIQENENLEPVEEVAVDEASINEAPMDFSSDSSLLNVPAKQFMVEKISGLMVASDTVRMDGEVIAQWHDLYEKRQIREVQIQTLEGKATSCKFKILKENEGNSKGIIQIPDKILQTLQTSKGKLVIVKPVIT